MTSSPSRQQAPTATDNGKPGGPGRLAVRPAIAVHNVTHHYDARAVDTPTLDRVTFDIPEGQFVCLVGPSGCGKSTVLNLCSQLLPLHHGAIEVFGTDVGKLAPGVLGYVGQESNLLPWRTVLANVALPARLMGSSKKAAEQTARGWLHRVGLEDTERLYPQELSGGMQRRAAVARTLSYSPRILLMDEPFGALDAITRTTLQEELVALWEQLGSTVMFVTHDLSEAILLADRVLVMAGGLGRIVDDIDITFTRPRDSESVVAESEFATIHARIWSQLSDRSRASGRGSPRPAPDRRSAAASAGDR